jgi:hypothetical protein
VPAEFERLVDELEERLAGRRWSLSRGPDRVTITTVSGGSDAGVVAWVITELTTAYDPVAGVWLVTESQSDGSTLGGGASRTSDVGRFTSAVAAIQVLASRAGS